MSVQPESILIIGASAAGVSAARTLRQQGYDKKLVIVDADANGSYERPPLSKAILQNPELQASSIALLSQSDVEELNITTLYGQKAVALDTSSRSVTLADGAVHSADIIVLATGGKARSLPIPGADAEGVFVLRDFIDAEQLRQKLSTKSRVAMIGGGFIGAETVASLAAMGHELTWIDAAPEPLAHVLPHAICQPLLAWHKSTGVNIIASARIKQFNTFDGAVSSIDFEDGSRVDVDCIVMGVGMAANAELAETAELDLELGGIKVDANQLTSAENIYACGDVAVFTDGNGQPKRDEHWQAAEFQGANTARAILGEPLLDKPVAWFWSDQGENHIEMAGYSGEQSVIREEGDWPVVFELSDGKIVGAVSINNPNAVRVALRLIKSGAVVPAEELADTSTDLRKLLRR